MLISKFDLYKSEWLELVFDNRNKDYGAYELRQHYARNMVMAMGFTFSFIALVIGGGLILKTNTPMVHVIQVTTQPIIPVVPPPVQPIKRIEPPAHIKPIKPLAPAPAAPTIKYVEMVVKPDDQAQAPVKNDQLATATISQTTNPGKGTAENELPKSDAGMGTSPAPDNTVYSTGGVDVMPEPVGGDKAWAKFLNKNLRFPPVAQEDGISGRVILSFIIEKDGSLSNILVVTPAGHGFDEEALRVLKLAKAWKPGQQNGQPVRVKYMIPINFQLADGN